MTSRTGRTLNAMTPPTRRSSSSARSPTAAPSRQIERRSVGRVAVRAGSSRPTTRTTAGARGITRSATVSRPRLGQPAGHEIRGEEHRAAPPSTASTTTRRGAPEPGEAGQRRAHQQHAERSRGRGRGEVRVHLRQPGERRRGAPEPPAHRAGQLRAAHRDERGARRGPERRHHQTDRDRRARSRQRPLHASERRLDRGPEQRHPPDPPPDHLFHHQPVAVEIDGLARRGVPGRTRPAPGRRRC